MPAKKKSQEAINFNKLVGKRIKLFRTMARMKLSDVAKVIGVTTAQVSTYERGTGDLKISIMKKIAEAFSIPIYELFPPMDENYKPLSKELITLISYMQEKNIDITEVLELVKEYYSENLFETKEKIKDGK